MQTYEEKMQNTKHSANFKNTKYTKNGADQLKIKVQKPNTKQHTNTHKSRHISKHTNNTKQLKQ